VCPASFVAASNLQFPEGFDSSIFLRPLEREGFLLVGFKPGCQSWEATTQWLGSLGFAPYRPAQAWRRSKLPLRSQADRAASSGPATWGVRKNICAGIDFKAQDPLSSGSILQDFFVFRTDPTLNDIGSHKVGLILSNLSIGLFALYLVYVIFDILPFRLLDPVWMITFASALCNSSSIPLAGLAFMHLSTAFNPDSQLIKSRRNLSARLAAWAALGFLMLLPLIGYANWRGIRNIELTNKANIATINAKANQLKDQISQASTQRDLQERMAKFQGPALPNEALNMPLEQLKRQSLAVVQSSAKAFETKIPGPFTEQYMPIYKLSLRAAAISLVAAVGFAAGAWNPRTNMTALNSIASLFKVSPYKSGSIFNVFTSKIKGVQKDSQNKNIEANRLYELRNNARNIEKLRRQQDLMQKRNIEKQRKAAVAREKRRLQEERKAQKQKD
jgi:hypothetical protein